MRALKRAAQFALVYITGLVFTPAYFLLKGNGLVQVLRGERLPRWKRSILVVLNHPSLLEPFVVGMLFFREWILSPAKWMPWFTPDRTNLTAKLSWFFWLGGARNIPIPRKREKDESRMAYGRAVYKALRKVAAVLRVGGRVTFFPEGGRTGSVPLKDRRRSPKGKELRPLLRVVGKLIERAKPTVLLVWFGYPWATYPEDERENAKWFHIKIRERTWRVIRPSGWLPIRIKIGQPMRFDGLKPSAIVEILQKSMMALADEGED